jgi:hypothetical protein
MTIKFNLFVQQQSEFFANFKTNTKFTINYEDNCKEEKEEMTNSSVY